jgi:RNA polymerase primary sigma factor/RNA polymerase sigma factor
MLTACDATKAKPRKNMHSDYRLPAIKLFRDRLRASMPRADQLACVDRVEELLGEMAPTEIYRLREVGTRLNGSSQPWPDTQALGGDLVHDLRLLMDEVSDSVELPIEAAGQRVLTLEELARQLNVSTKTITRWRRHGLVSRKFVVDDRKRIGFLQSSVERFVARNPDLVRRGAQFSQMSLEDRQRVIDDARRLAAAGVRPSEVIRQMAIRTGRSIETIRYTLRHFDRRHPGAAVFPEQGGGRLGADAKRRIYQQYRRGESIETLSRRLRRGPKLIRRVVDEMRARSVMELPLECVEHESFARVRLGSRQEEEIIADLPPPEAPLRKPRLPKDLPSYLASLYEVPLLTGEQERLLFRKMNYLKYRAGQLRRKLDPQRPRAALMDRIESLYEQSVATKNQIIRANLRLVVAIAKRRVGNQQSFFDLVSDGNMSLIRAVERFDFSRGNKFSTYASWAIMKNFARSIPDHHRHHDRYRTSQGEIFETAVDVRTNQFAQEHAQAERVRQIRRVLGRLDEREQDIIVRRFGLAEGREPRTLREVGAELGVTKERVRQIEARAFSKLRNALQEEKVDLPI